MNNYIFYDSTGTIKLFQVCKDGVEAAYIANELLLQYQESPLINIEEWRVVDGKLQKSAATSLYVSGNATEDVYQQKLREVSTLFDVKSSTPIIVFGIAFDADRVSRERISGTIARLQRGDGLPAGWLGWRDAANEMHWVDDDAPTVLANLVSLSRAIEDREQALLIVAWQHKAAIASLTDIDAILSYDVTAGWPA